MKRAVLGGVAAAGIALINSLGNLGGARPALQPAKTGSGV
jgi:hypothetical protein